MKQITMDHRTYKIELNKEKSKSWYEGWKAGARGLTATLEELLNDQDHTYLDGDDPEAFEIIDRLIKILEPHVKDKDKLINQFLD